MTDPTVDADAAQILHSALAGDGNAVAGAFDAVVNRGGVGAAYDVAWCIAERTVGPDLRPGMWRLEFPGIESAGYDARWVARFLSAYANADRLTGEALIGAADDDGALRDCLLMLAGSAIATLLRNSPPE